MEIRDEPHSVLSRRLPFIVVESLLEQLDIFSLKTLRLVCKTTKSWVETPELLRHFPVVITSESRLSALLQSPLPVCWNTFVFSKKYKCLSDADIKRFLATFGDLALHLEFNWSPEKMQQELRLLSGCPHLESLRSNQLSFETLLPDVLTRRLLENWRHLRHFHVQRFRGGPSSPLTEMTFFSRVLSTCTHLESLTVPQFSYDYQPMPGFDYGDSFQRLVVTPLLEAIGKGRLRHVTVPYYGLTDEIFLRLAIACRESGTVLHNVRTTFLKSLPPEHLSAVDIIGSLDGATDAIIRQPLTNVRSICFVNPSFHLENHAYTLPPFAHLTVLEFDFKFSSKVSNQKSIQLFVHRLAKVTRPTVKSLRITYQPGPPVVFPINISPLDLCASFVNLRVLHVKDWEGEDVEWRKLWPLAGQNLVELSLANCRNLTDRGILGDDPNQAAILQLKHLRKLSLINYLYVDLGQVNITELSFIHAFRHMRLRSFHFFDGNLLVAHRSIPATAVESLWNGPFGETIEDFILQETDLENLDLILKHQKNGSGTTGEFGGKKKDKRRRKHSDPLFRSSFNGVSFQGHGSFYNTNNSCSIA